MKGKTALFIILILTMSYSLYAQIQDLSLTLNYFNNFEIFYVFDFDFENGSNSADVIEYTLAYTPVEDTATITVTMEFQMTANIPLLGLYNTQIFRVLTKPFKLKKGSITIGNRNIDLNVDGIYYDYTHEPVTGIDIESSEYMDEEQFSGLQNVVLAGGQLPAGTYLFAFQIRDMEGNVENVIQGIDVTNPSTIDLTSPGGMLEENLEVYTTYPVFNWESQQFMWNNDVCPECGYHIRVSEYQTGIHSSPQEALWDNPNVPFPDNGGYFNLAEYDPTIFMIPVEFPGGLILYTASTAFQYTETVGRPLENGKTYVWQVRKIYPTTSGDEFVDSDIYAFSIPSMGEGTEGEETGGGGGGTAANPFMQIIEQLIGSDAYYQYFTGELSGYYPTGVVLLNGTDQLTQDDLTTLIGQLSAGEIQIISVGIE